MEDQDLNSALAMCRDGHFFLCSNSPRFFHHSVSSVLRVEASPLVFSFCDHTDYDPASMCWWGRSRLLAVCLPFVFDLACELAKLGDNSAVRPSVPHLTVLEGILTTSSSFLLLHPPSSSFILLPPVLGLEPVALLINTTSSLTWLLSN